MSLCERQYVIAIFIPLNHAGLHGAKAVFSKSVILRPWVLFRSPQPPARSSFVMFVYSTAFQGVFIKNNYLSSGCKSHFYRCHLGRLKLTFTGPNIISTSPKNVLMSRLISQFFCNLNSSKNFTCPSGKLITELTSLIAKSTSPRLSDTTFFARWSSTKKYM